MNWKFDFSPETSDIFAVWWRCRGLSEGRWWYPLGLVVAKFERRRNFHFAAPWRLCAGGQSRPNAGHPVSADFIWSRQANTNVNGTITYNWYCMILTVTNTVSYSQENIARFDHGLYSSYVCLFLIIMHILLSLKRFSITPFLKPSIQRFTCIAHSHNHHSPQSCY